MKHIEKIDNMTQLMSKGKIVEEVDKEIKNNTSKQGWHFDEYTEGYLDALKNIKTFLDTLEVKEIGVDLGDPKGDKSAKYIIDTKTLEVKEMDLDFEHELYKAFGQVKDFTLGMCIARHFYELGLRAKKVE